MYNVAPILKKSLPFLMTIFLWRLSVYFWNPAGILALIPIFYYTFVRHIHGFTFFGLLFCFLIDYRCDLPLLWTILFCLFYAVNGFQNYIDMQNADNNAIKVFMIFIGIGIFLLIFSGLTWMNFINNIWLFVWLSILYTPITAIDNWAKR
ncbi:MAG: hypothetical protein IKP35_04710 [Alphaproteobacteria bacterium]|nr:hypothetical protein [Alphaproteobacteria bacterium]